MAVFFCGLRASRSGKSDSEESYYFVRQSACEVLLFTEWHVSVIALLMFTLSFGMMAIVLSLGGLCSSSLPKKIYYYHSAGEIYVICGQF